MALITPPLAALVATHGPALAKSLAIKTAATAGKKAAATRKRNQLARRAAAAAAERLGDVPEIGDVEAALARWAETWASTTDAGSLVDSWLCGGPVDVDDVVQLFATITAQATGTEPSAETARSVVTAMMEALVRDVVASEGGSPTATGFLAGRLDAAATLTDARTGQEAQRSRDEADAHHAEASEDRRALRRDAATLQTDIRGVDEKMDRLLASETLPDEVRDAVSRGVFDQLSVLLEADDGDGALALATHHLGATDAVIADAPHGHIAANLVSYRQRLLFVMATTASWAIDGEAARRYARRALALGPVDPAWHVPALAALFNAGLRDSLDGLRETMDDDAPARAEASLLLAHMDDDWDAVDAALVGETAPDKALMRAQAHVERLDPADPGAAQQAHDLLSVSEGTPALPALDILRARLSVMLLDAVVAGYTPLSFDRRPLADAVLRRALHAAESTPAGSPLRARAVGVLGDAAVSLRDPALADRFNAELDGLSDAVRDAAFVSQVPPPTVAEVARRLSLGHIDVVRAALLTARALDASGDEAAAEASLHAALYTPEPRHRAAILADLVRRLRQSGRAAEAAPLLAVTLLPDSDRWLVQAQAGGPLDLDGADAFRLDVPVLVWVSFALLRDDGPTDAPAPTDDASPDPPIGQSNTLGRASLWTARLRDALPSRSSRLLHAEALSSEAAYDDLFDVLGDLDPTDADRAAELRAFALQALGRYDAAAQTLDAAVAASPTERLAINASAALLQADRPRDAARLLAPRVEQGADDPHLLVNYARALLVQAPDDPNVAGQAFDLLARAYDRMPLRRIAVEAWQAAMGAGREKDAGRFVAAMTEGATHIEIRTAADAEAALAGTPDGEGYSGATQFSGNHEAFFAAMARQHEQAQARTDAVNRLSVAHMLSYADTFRVSGRAWQNWTRWTRLATDRAVPDAAPGHAVLADWPSSALEIDRKTAPFEGVLADVTALLTLGVLGAELAAEILRAAAPVYVYTGTLAALRDEQGQIENEVLVGGRSRYRDAVDALRGSSAVVPYDADAEAGASDDPALGASRVDLGVAARLGGRFVTDRDAVDSWADDSQRLALASPVLLATLNAEALVSSDAADAAADLNPVAFGGWRTAAALDALPDALILDRSALLDWFGAGLLPALGDRLRVGPWTWMSLVSEADDVADAATAYHRLRATVSALAAATADGHVDEVTPEGSADDPDPDAESRAESRAEALQRAWTAALRALETARVHRLALWADDRFYPLLFWTGGPTLPEPPVEEVRASLGDPDDRPPTFPTVDLADRLALDGALDAQTARRIAGTLFDHGYRPVHPLVLEDALGRSRLGEGQGLRGRFRLVARAAGDLADALPDTIPPPRRDGFARAGAGALADRMIAAAWTIPDLSDAQRRTLADGFLDAVEQVFLAHSAPADPPADDRTRLLFWGAALTALQTLPTPDDSSFLRRQAALEWLGDAAARRTDHLADVVREIEDHALASSTFAQHAAEAPAEIVPLLAGRYALTALTPLFAPALLSHLDPLLRRTLGRLARLPRAGRTDTTFSITVDGELLSLVVPEERDEAAAADVVHRSVAGDTDVTPFFHPTGVAFAYECDLPQEWTDAGVPAETTVFQNVRVSFFVLLWNEVPDLVNRLLSALIRHLVVADPHLAGRLHGHAEGLLSDEPDLNEAARDALSLDLLGSVFFEMQRDLAHGMRRLRRASAAVLKQYLGHVGTETATALYDLAPPVQKRVHADGDLLVQRTHLSARALLTESFDDQALVAAAIHASGSDADVGLENIEEWLSDRALTAEVHADPFVAAYSLRHVLLAIRTSPESLSVKMGGERLDASVWAARYIDAALAPDGLDTDLTGLQPGLALRRRLARAALRFACHVCGGPNHVAEYFGENEGDPLSGWITAVWVMTSKLLAVLPAEHGGLVPAVDAAEAAVSELGLNSLTARALDCFDPFALAGPDDIGRVLTLAALAKSLPPDPAAAPPWWTPAVAARCAAMAAQPAGEHDASAGDLGDRLGVGLPLRERPLARHLLDRLGSPPDDDAPDA